MSIFGDAIRIIEVATIRGLRRNHPGWTWRAERAGMGWEYVGARAGERVRVYAVSLLSGYDDDRFETQWRIDDGKTSTPLLIWDDPYDPAHPQPQEDSDNGR